MSNPSRTDAKEDVEPSFTGERVIPGKVEPDLFNEHFARYAYAQQFCSDKRVLDTGCGVGYGSRHLAEVAAEVIGLDLDPQAIAYARAHFSAQNLIYVAGDSQRLPFATGSFDVVTSFELIEHLSNANEYLTEMQRVLNQGGLFIVSTPNRSSYGEHRGGAPNPFHQREWDFGEFSGLLRAYFPFVEFLAESHLPAIGILPRTRQASAHLQSPGSPEESDYFVCVCSKEPLKSTPGLVYVPSSANVLLERERHLRIVMKELDERNAYLAKLQPEFEEKARWADALNQQVVQLQTEISRLQLAHAAAVSDNARLQTESRRLSGQVEILSALWRKQTRGKRVLASLALLPFDFVVALSLIGSEWLGRALRLISRIKPPEFSLPKRECSFIIVSWNGKDLLAESLPALLEAVRRQGGNHQIIVVDNGSIDGTSEFVRQNFPDVVLVRSEQNLYFGGGNRLGLQKATRDILVLLNNDMMVDPEFLEPLIQGFSDPTVFGLASQVFLPADKRREETGKTRAEFNGSDMDWRHDPITIADEAALYTPVLWLHGGATAIDRRKYEWLDGLDEIYDPFYVEDADLSYRAWKVGWRCLLACNSRVLHKHRSSTQRFGDGFIRQIVRRNHYIFVWKNFNSVGWLARHFLHAGRVRARRAGVPGVGIQREVRAYFGALKRLPSILARRIHLARSVSRTDGAIISMVNEPPPSRITSSDVDFSCGDFDDYLGGRWYKVERAGQRPYRWIGDKAWLFLRAPAENVELVLQGYAPPLSNYGAGPLLLTVLANGREQRIQVCEGSLSYRLPLAELKRNEPIRIELKLNRTIRNANDQRILGVMLHRIALLSTGQASSTAENPSLIHEMSFAGTAATQTMPSGEVPKRLLFICAYLPCVGLHGGGNTMFHLIRTLSRRYRITVFSLFDRDAEPPLAARLLPYCERLEVLRRGQTFDAPNPFGIMPANIVYEFYHRGMQRKIDELLGSEQFDIIDCEYLQTGHFLLNHPGIPAVLSHHEVYSMSIWNRCKSLPLSLEKLKASVEWMRMLNYEEKIFRRFSSVLLVTEKEREYLQKYLPRVAAYAHATGVDTDFFSPSTEPHEAGSVAFLGNFQHAPNVGGLLWFVENVWSCVRARESMARLYVVGGDPPDAVRSLNGKNGIHVTGWVQDVRPFLQKSALFVAPMLDGVGLRGKILEAWAMAKPVIATSLALLGLDHPDGYAGLVADDPAMFADRICRLLNDEGLAREMGKRARELVISSYSWEAFADFYDAAYRRAMQATRPASAAAPGQAAITFNLEQTTGAGK